METKVTGKKRKGIKPAVGIITVLIGIVAIVGGILAIKNSLNKGIASVVTVYDEDRNETTIYIDEKSVATVEGITMTERNMSDSVYYITDENFTVYCVEGNKIELVGENLELITIANNSNEALFLNSFDDLCRYDGRKLEVITEYDFEFAAISGDGKTYAYYMDGDSYFGTKPGKEKKVEDVMITYFSDDGKCIYAVDELYDEDDIEMDMMEYIYGSGQYSTGGSLSLYMVNKSGEKELLKEDISNILGLNADGTEIVYLTIDGTYITVNGVDTYDVTDKWLDGINYADNRYGYYHYYPVESFKDSVWSLSDRGEYVGCCYISEDYKAITIAKDCESILDTDSELTKIIYITTDARLCVADVKKDAKVQEIANDVIDARMSLNGEHIYYVNLNEKMELHYVNKDMNDSKIKEFDFYSGIYVVGDGCYTDNNGAIYVKGDEVIEIKEREGFFVDEITEKAYNMGKNKLYILDGAKEKELKGDFELLSFYEVVQ